MRKVVLLFGPRWSTLGPEVADWRERGWVVVRYTDPSSLRGWTFDKVMFVSGWHTRPHLELDLESMLYLRRRRWWVGPRETSLLMLRDLLP